MRPVPFTEESCKLMQDYVGARELWWRQLVHQSRGATLSRRCWEYAHDFLRQFLAAHGVSNGSRYNVYTFLTFCSN